MYNLNNSSNMKCNPKPKDSILRYTWIDNTTDNNIVIDKITQINLCTKEEAFIYLQEYHKFQYCLGKEFRTNEHLQDQMLLFPSAIVSRIWRLHQLFTQEYPSLCRDLGFNFISFNPEKLCFWSKNEKEIESLRSIYKNTLSILKNDFNGDLNENVWPPIYEDMVKQHLLSFHLNLTTYKHIQNNVNNLNGILKFQDMSISDIKNKVIPELRKDLPSFETTDFVLQNPQDQSERTLNVFNILQNVKFPPEMVQHIQNEYLLTPEATEMAILEYKKFFMMFLIDKNFSQVPSAFVDEIWHTHINFAKIYAISCRVLAGEFINHAPATNIAENEQEMMNSQFDLTMQLYQKLFGKVNEQYWQLEGELYDEQQQFLWVDLYDINKKSQHSCSHAKEFILNQEVSQNDGSYLFNNQSEASCCVECKQREAHFQIQNNLNEPGCCIECKQHESHFYIQNNLIDPGCCVECKQREDNFYIEPTQQVESCCVECKNHENNYYFVHPPCQVNCCIKNKSVHGYNTQQSQKPNIIRFCGGCYKLDESAYERSNMNFSKIEQNVIQMRCLFPDEESMKRSKKVYII